jgi:mannobiose 2-epimerase
VTALSKKVKIGNIIVGGGESVKIQSMTTTRLSNLSSSIESALELERAGCEIVRFSVLDENDAKSIVKKTYDYTILISKRILDVAFDGEALNNESRGEIQGNEHIDTDRIWWVQGEAVVGFVNAYQVTKDEKFLDAAKKIFSYIENVLTDKREGSEWFWAVSKAGIPDTHGITEPWKCPYHNGRMCLELISRGFSI